MLEFVQWLQATSFFTAFRGSWYVYPIVMSTHLAAIALFGGMILMVDMRLLGLAMTKRPISDLIDQLRVPKRIGFIILATCGILMFGSKAEEYYYNIFFRLKMLLLVLVFLHAMAFRGSVYGNAAAMDKAGRVSGVAKLAAALSFCIWLGLVICGRGIGYIEPPLSKIHARVNHHTPAVVAAVATSHTAPISRPLHQ
jgi:hypothetical protein